MPFSSTAIPLLPRAFVWRRLHSLTGIFLVLFLIFHLITNSQASLFFDADGGGFVNEVNSIHTFPYLVVVEILLLGVPFAIHMFWGVRYLWMAAYNDKASDGTTPALPYSRNRAYSWQRITSWFLLFLVVAHVVHMRLLNYASSAKVGDKVYYMQRVGADPGLYSVAYRLGTQLVNAQEINAAQEGRGAALAPFPPAIAAPTPTVAAALAQQRKRQTEAWLGALKAWPLGPQQLVAIAPDFGTATLLMVRETFKSTWMALIYSFFVITACYHAFNGLWTSCITWGVTLSERSQQGALRLCQGLMVLLALLGLAAIWGTYWITLNT